MQVELYSSISELKNSQDSRTLSDEEIFIRVLDLMDFYATLSKNSDLPSRENDSIEWIELPFK